jgi:tRNA-splicing ligase RtcB
MDFCLQFAFENRQKMMDDVLVALDENCDFEKVCEINVHHNYVAHENHFGHNVWVHRKGATSARDGQVCLIPGSMGTASYIGIGLGNKWSFNSCSHGAGRVMSRTKANETITEEMANQSIGNVVFGRWNGDYSECPLAYKNVDQVMKDQEDLVRAEVKLTPLGVMKG